MTSSTFRVIGKISSGTYGDVVIIDHQQQFCALKICIWNKGNNIKQSVFIRDSIREFFFAKSLLGKHARAYFVNEFVDNTIAFGISQTLAVRNLHEIGRLQIQQVRLLFPPILAQLNDLHSHGILHRDIKPQNILQMKDGTLLLTDPSLCVRDLAPKNTNVITLWYRPPELLLEADCCTPASEIWSLAITILDTLLARPLFSCIHTETKMVTAIGKFFGCSLSDPEWYVHNVPFQLGSLQSFSLDEDLQDLLSKMLIVDPTKRITLKDIQRHKFWTSAQEPLLDVIPTKVACKPVNKCFFYASHCDALRLETIHQHDISNVSTVETRLLVLDLFCKLAITANWPMRVILSALYFWDIYASKNVELARKRVVLAAVLFCAISIETDEETFDALHRILCKEDLSRFQAILLQVIRTVGPTLPPIYQRAHRVEKCKTGHELLQYALGPKCWQQDISNVEHQTKLTEEDIQELLSCAAFENTFLKTHYKM